MAEQLQLFASLDFPGRSTLYLWEIADRLGCTVAHLLNKVDEGALDVLDLASADSSRRAVRVPIESYRAFVLKHFTGKMEIRMQFLRDLPAPVLRELFEELKPLIR